MAQASADTKNIDKDMEIVRWLWRESRGVKRYVVLTALAGIFGVGCSLWFVWVTKHIVDIATHRSGGSWIVAVAMLVVALICQLITKIASRRVGVVAQTRFSNSLRARLFTLLMRAEWCGKERFHSADAVNRLAGDVATASSMVTATVPSAVVTVVQLIAAFVFMLCLEPKMAWVLVIIMPVALACSKLYMKPARRLTKMIRSEESNMQAIMQEHLQHRVLISSMRQVEGSVREFSASQNRFYASIMKRNDISIFANTAVTIGFMAGYSVAFLWCAAGLYTGAVTFGVMTAFLQLVSQIQRPVVDLAGKVPAVVQANVAVERLQEVMELPQESSAEGVILAPPVGMRLSDVGFMYPDGDEMVISELDWDFKPNTMTAVAGRTGAGKTTLLLLLLGLLKPNRGEVTLYNDRESVQASAETRSNISFVPQGNSLLSGTVRSNLLLSNPNASEEEMISALRRAAADFVLELPDGLDSQCGERGTGFSEGQAQRIAIARGLLGAGGILLLDEPTSALDNRTEQRVIETLRKEAERRTVIVVSHSEQLLEASGVSVLMING